MWYSLSLLLLTASTATASYAGNLNYRSPSYNHPELGVSIRKVAKRGEPTSAFDPAKLNFTHGVASGDPYAESVILWTRCAPGFDDVNDNSTTSGLVPLYNPVPIYSGKHNKPVSKAPVCLNYKVSRDAGMKKVVSEGTVFTSSDIDYTVKVSTIACYLSAATHHAYFMIGRGNQVEAVYYILLPVQRVQLGQHESHWTH
jgi:alkaline phosphatase D